jgi:hypothetical protein
LNALFIEGDAQLAKSDSLEVSSSLPGIDDVAFNGVMALVDLNSEAEEGYIGDVVVDADFASNALTATATGFYFQAGEAPGEARGGELVFSSSDVGVGIVSVFSGTLAGDLDLGSGLEDLTGLGDGRFLGDDADMVIVVGSVNEASLDFLITAD